MKEYKLIITGTVVTVPTQRSLGLHVNERDALIHALKVIDPSADTLVYITQDMAQKPRCAGMTPGWYVRHDFGPDTYCGDSSSIDDVLTELAKASPAVYGIPTAVRLVVA